MNISLLIGRLVKDPEIRYTQGQNPTAVATFTLAVDRPTRVGADKQTDFPRITVFGRQAENCEKYIHKGSLVAVEGHIQTGKYQNKDGYTVYTTDVVANRIKFLEPIRTAPRQGEQSNQAYIEPKETEDEIPDNFEKIDEDVPF